MKKSNRLVILMALTPFIALPSIFFQGCSQSDVQKDNPTQLYQEALDDIENDHYQLAIDKLRMIRNKFPYSSVSVDAQLKIADVYFLQESFAEAALSYESFVDLHPKHEKVPYAMFRMAKSHFNDIPSNVARDLTPAFRAETAYQEYRQKFPKGEHLQEAKADLAETRRVLASKELYIATFYIKQEKYDSARTRLKKVLDLYPDTPVAEEARKEMEKLP